MYFKTFQIPAISALLVMLLAANPAQQQKPNPQEKPKLLYFNANDTATFLVMPNTLRLLKNPDAQPVAAPYYHRAFVQPPSFRGILYRIGPRNFYAHSLDIPSHTKRYISHDSLQYYEIVKAPWTNKEFPLLDLSNPDSAFFVTVIGTLRTIN